MARKSKYKTTSSKAKERSNETVTEANAGLTASSENTCRVFAHEGPGASWFENANVKMMSRFGIGFSLSRDCAVGTLIRLEVPLPTELRPFDSETELFDAIALVQHSSRTAGESESAYHINAMFVGKKFPETFDRNRKQAYRLSASNGDGTWTVTECATGHRQRRFPRFSIELGVELGLIQKRERTVVKESTVTRDVGSSGVSVITTLRAAAGDKVKFGCPDLDFYTIATVVKRRNFFGIRDVLHLKFIDERFPVERLLFSSAAGTINIIPKKYSSVDKPQNTGTKHLLEIIDGKK